MSAVQARDLVNLWAERSLSKWQRRALKPAQREALAALFEAREDAALDYMRLAGAQFGMYPFIVAKVLAQTGLGTPLSDQEQQAIHDAYVAGMNALVEAQRRAQEGDGNN